MPLIEKKLTAKQQAFADFYIELGNVEQVAIKAGYSKAMQEVMLIKKLQM